jgi:hypothetical protein
LASYHKIDADLYIKLGEEYHTRLRVRGGSGADGRRTSRTSYRGSGRSIGRRSLSFSSRLSLLGLLAAEKEPLEALLDLFKSVGSWVDVSAVFWVAQVFNERRSLCRGDRRCDVNTYEHQAC